MNELGPLPRQWDRIDKSDWGPGPWQDEPDKIHWIDEATDLDCLMVRHPASGHWCGYVGVTEPHPWFGLHYGDCIERKVDAHGDPEACCDHAVEADVHGGITFAAACDESEDPGTGICHVALPGRPDHVWWFGFDMHHLHDLAPGHEYRDRMGLVYRDVAYVQSECRSLAQQLKAIA